MAAPEAVIACKAIQIAAIVVFAVAVLDVRTKAGMKQLAGARRIQFVKLLCVAGLAAYVRAVVIEDAHTAVDLVTIALTLLGTALVVKGKLDLAEHHTWSGYHLERPGLCARGIYARIRHPMYTGIFVFMAGAIWAVMAHGSEDSIVIGLVAAGLVCAHLIVAASRETAALRQSLGAEHERYCRQVHSFLPLRRYQPPAAEDETHEIDPECRAL